MEKKDKIHHPAIKMKAKAAKKLAELKHCCIPKTVVKTEVIEHEDGASSIVNPDIKPNGNGKFGKEGSYYKELKAKRVAYLKSNYSGKFRKSGHRIRRKQPWYMLTSGKCYNYEERKTSYGAATMCFRIKSESQKLYERTLIPRFTREELIIRLLSAKLKDWEDKNKRPIPENDIQQHMFKEYSMKLWETAKEEAEKKIKAFIANIGKRVKVFARYKKDLNGYPHEIMQIKSDGSKFITDDGKFTNPKSKVVAKVQRKADVLYKENPELVALKIVDGSQECIITPRIAA